MPDDSPQSASSEAEDESSASDSDKDSEPPVELLVTSRAKRAGAGSRIQKLIEQEEDELADYFNKNADDVDSDEDVDFEGDDDEAASDAQLDSSSSDEEQEPGKTADDLEGEKLLQKQERAEKQKKRKAENVFKAPSALRKKARINPVSTSTSLPITPAPRLKKKSDRVSWIPNTEEGPVRSSSRKQTMQNKETIHLRMAEKEKQRVKQMKHMEEAERKRRAAKAPPMTQAERIAEAARTERKNAKSLNRWEESEKKRAELQKAKLEALHNRQLQGPVISWWSGVTRWVNGKLSQIGIQEIKEIEKVNPDKDHAVDSDNPHLALDNGVTPADTQGELLATALPDQSALPGHQATETPIRELQEKSINRGFEPTPGLGFLDGIHYYASLSPQIEKTTAMVNGTSSTPTNMHLALLSADPNEPDPIEHPAAFVEKSTSPIHLEPIKPVPPPKMQGPMIEYASRSLVILQNIYSNAANLPELQNSVLLKKRANKTQKPSQELCAITGFPARFRDPKTGLPYADSYAYREIQRLRTGGSRWSSLLGCYVGSATAAARGVPERFRRR